MIRRSTLYKRSLFLILFAFLQIAAFAQHSEYPAYTSSEAPPPGIYSTIEDYLTLRPQNPDVIFQHTAQMEGEGLNTFYLKKENGKKGEKVSPKDCFAASDGKTFYISYSGKWYKATKADGEYSFIAKLNPAAVHAVQPELPATGVSISTTSYSGSSSVSFEYPYRMKLSLADRKWLPVERVKKEK